MLKHFKKISLFLIIFIVMLLFNQCKQKATKESIAKPEITEEQWIKINEQLAKNEQEQIDSYIERHNLPMKQTKSGLRIGIYKHTNNSQPKYGHKVTISYTLSLITGEVVYSSEKEGDKTFIIGRNEVPKGLEEAVMLMRIGEKAHVVIPSHLAYGLVGDGKVIPAKAVLIYDINNVK